MSNIEIPRPDNMGNTATLRHYHENLQRLHSEGDNAMDDVLDESLKDLVFIASNSTADVATKAMLLRNVLPSVDNTTPLQTTDDWRHMLQLAPLTLITRGVPDLSHVDADYAEQAVRVAVGEGRDHDSDCMGDLINFSPECSTTVLCPAKNTCHLGLTAIQLLCFEQASAELSFEEEVAADRETVINRLVTALETTQFLEAGMVMYTSQTLRSQAAKLNATMFWQ